MQQFVPKTLMNFFNFTCLELDFQGVRLCLGNYSNEFIKQVILQENVAAKMDFCLMKMKEVLSNVTRSTCKVLAKRASNLFCQILKIQTCHLLVSLQSVLLIKLDT